MLVTAGPQGRQLSLGVNGADLRAVGYVDHLGDHHVLTSVVLRQDEFYEFRGHLAVRAADSADLMAGGLDGAGLVGIHVAGVGGDDRLVGSKERGNGHKVCLGAAHHEVDVCVRGAAQLTDEVGSLFTVVVKAVAAGLLQIGVHQGLHDLGVGAFAVIVAETVHWKNLLSFKVYKFLLKSYRLSCINASRERENCLIKRKR